MLKFTFVSWGKFFVFIVLGRICQAKPRYRDESMDPVQWENRRAAGSQDPSTPNVSHLRWGSQRLSTSVRWPRQEVTKLRALHTRMGLNPSTSKIHLWQTLEGHGKACQVAGTGLEPESPGQWFIWLYYAKCQISGSIKEMWNESHRLLSELNMQYWFG